MSRMEHFIPVTPKYNSPLRVHLTTKSITIQPLNIFFNIQFISSLC